MKSGLLGNSLECLLFQIIFVTALFYLLSSSGEQYKPVEWFGKLSATGTAGFGDSAYGAIRFVKVMCQFLPQQNSFQKLNCVRPVYFIWYLHDCSSNLAH